MHAKVIIIGSGPAGYTAAIYAARAMLEPVMIDGGQPGGQLTITTDVENYPGFADVIQGPWLMDQMKAQALHVGTRIVSDIITAVDFDHRPFVLTGDSGKRYTADAVIVATGAQARWLGIPSEEKFKGFGVSACATCDGFFYRNKHVIVVGGGNTAVEEALFLTNFASKVTVIHRRDSFRAERILQDRLFRHPKIEVRWNTELADVGGTSMPPSLNQVTLRSTVTGETETMPIDGVFVAIGHTPATAIFSGKLDMKPGGYLQVRPGTTETNIAGVFAAGDVTDDVYRQAVTAAGMGCMAALEAERFLAEHQLAEAAEVAMLDWDKLRIFHTAAEAGSFTHAAEKLNMSQSAVSRQISALEDDLKLKLFIRHARGLVLTEVGEQLFRTAHRMHWELQQVETQMSDSQDAPTGPLLVTTTVGIGSTWLASRINEFLPLYPDIQIEIKLNDAELDLAMREADVAIRLHRPNQSEMIQRRLFTVHNHFYASEAYLAEHGEPTSIEALDEEGHRVITFGEPVPSFLGDINFLERLGRPDSSPRRSTLRVNAITGMMQAARAGIGIAMLPDYVTENQATLRRVLTGIEIPAYEAYFVYPPALKNSKRVGVFRDFLVGKAREWSF